MDNFNDSITLADTGLPGGAAIDKLASSAKNILKGLRDKKKAKEAQEISDSGNYFTLRQYLKNLIVIPNYVIRKVADKNISEYAIIQLAPMPAGTSDEEILRQLEAVQNAPIPSGVDPDVAALKTSFIRTSNDGSGNTKIVSVDPTPVETKVKAYLPYIIGVVILGIVIYLIVKK